MGCTFHKTKRGSHVKVRNREWNTWFIFSLSDSVARRSGDSSANKVLWELKICHKLEPMVQQMLRHEWGYDAVPPYYGMRVMAIRLMTEELAELKPRTGTGKALLIWGRYISMNNQNYQRSGR